MLFKVALLMWFVALAIVFLSKAAARTWVIRLLIGGFCVLLLALFVRIISRRIW
jgi:hypothetical protein